MKEGRKGGGREDGECTKKPEPQSNDMGKKEVTARGVPTDSSKNRKAMRSLHVPRRITVYMTESERSEGPPSK